MAKVITFSRTFQKGHPKEGEPTLFVEKFWSAIPVSNNYKDQFIWPEGWLNQNFKPKYHTIRGGNRFKVGDWFSPRVWGGKPYNSKQVVIAPDQQVKQVWTFEFYHWGEMYIDGRKVNHDLAREIAKNDGLEWTDFYEWFPTSERKHFEGQIICWSDKIDYSAERWEQLKLTDVSLH